MLPVLLLACGDKSPRADETGMVDAEDTGESTGGCGPVASGDVEISSDAEAEAFCASYVEVEGELRVSGVTSLEEVLRVTQGEGAGPSPP